MSILNTENTALIIVDIQQKLLNAVFNKETVEKNSKILAKAFNILEVPVFVTEQYPQGLGPTIEEVKTNLSSRTVFYEKVAFNALCNDNLYNDLLKNDIKNIIICGIETHICVHQTVEALIQKGFNVTVIKDCCGSRNEQEYLSALNVMTHSGAYIKTTEMVLFEILKTAKHPSFKEIQALIK